MELLNTRAHRRDSARDVVFHKEVALGPTRLAVGHSLTPLLARAVNLVTTTVPQGATLPATSGQGPTASSENNTLADVEARWRIIRCGATSRLHNTNSLTLDDGSS